MNSFFEKLQQIEKFKIKSFEPISGGSINEVFLLITQERESVIKINNSKRFPGMMLAEKAGLEALRKTKSINIPEVYSVEEIEDKAYLIIEYIPKGNESPEFWERFAEGLSTLHKNTRTDFGFLQSNYIGSLTQYNRSETIASVFYINQRLEPQFKIATEKGYTFKNLEHIFINITKDIPDEQPALIHGDLWNGNYLAAPNGSPYLIDPATCYAPREMDMAMMKLFGGFPDLVFSIYDESFPLEKDFLKRVELWQLYYLLVHLNLFGSGYYSQVEAILKKYV